MSLISKIFPLRSTGGFFVSLGHFGDNIKNAVEKRAVRSVPEKDLLASLKGLKKGEVGGVEKGGKKIVSHVPEKYDEKLMPGLPGLLPTAAEKRHSNVLMRSIDSGPSDVSFKDEKGKLAIASASPELPPKVVKVVKALADATLESAAEKGHSNFKDENAKLAIGSASPELPPKVVKALADATLESAAEKGHSNFKDENAKLAIGSASPELPPKVVKVSVEADFERAIKAGDKKTFSYLLENHRGELIKGYYNFVHMAAEKGEEDMIIELLDSDLSHAYFVDKNGKVVTPEIKTLTQSNVEEKSENSKNPKKTKKKVGFAGDVNSSDFPYKDLAILPPTDDFLVLGQGQITEPKVHTPLLKLMRSKAVRKEGDFLESLEDNKGRDLKIGQEQITELEKGNLYDSLHGHAPDDVDNNGQQLTRSNTVKKALDQKNSWCGLFSRGNSARAKRENSR